jgi:hypothetical protein
MQKDLDSVVLTQSAWAETKHSMDPASVQQLLQGRIRQLQLPVPDSQPELLQKPETFEEYMRMMTRNPEMTPVRRAMRAQENTRDRCHVNCLDQEAWDFMAVLVSGLEGQLHCEQYVVERERTRNTHESSQKS